MRKAGLQFVGAILLSFFVASQSAHAQGVDPFALSAPVDTSTPNSTLQGFIASGAKLAQVIVERNGGADAQGGDVAASHGPAGKVVQDLTDQAATAIDLANVPPHILQRSKLERVLKLYEALRRVDAHVLAQAPRDGRTARWRIPGTPINLVRMSSGNRAGDYVFSADTVDDVDEIYARAVSRQPLWGRQPDSLAIIVSNLGQVGPSVLSPGVERLPASLLYEVAGNAIWKWLGFIAIIACGIGLTVLSFVLMRRVQVRGAFTELLISGLPILFTRVFAFLALRAVDALYMHESIYWLASSVLLSIAYAAWVWWLVVATVWLSKYAPTYFYPDHSIKAAVTRLSLRSFGIVIIGIIVARGLEQIGVPLLGIVAGLGVGGLALALAAQPTAENLIAGVILFVDQPARVGDECEFEGYRGVVEEIGIRSTSIRLSDGTLLTLTNSQFCNMKIRNLGVGHHQFSIDLPLDVNTDATSMLSFIDESLAALKNVAGVVAGSARVEIQSISAQGIFVQLSGRFEPTVTDPVAAWQKHQIAILGMAQQHNLKLASLA